MRDPDNAQGGSAVRLLLIRHAATAGNLEKRYIGRTDEPLCAAGIAALAQCRYPVCEILVSSPLRRCMETARILFPQQTPILCADLRECDFGDFEGKNYAELNGDPVYQAWIDSGGTLPFPHGESPADFRARSCAAFLQIMQAHTDAASIAMTVHGGTVMSVMQSLFGGNFYDYYTGNGDGYTFELEVDDAGDITAAGTYDRFCGRVRA